MCRTVLKMPRVAKGVTIRKSISLDTKLKILERIEENVGASAVGREFRMAESTVRTIVKNKDKILRSSQSATPLLKVNRSRGAIFEKMENRLSTWIKDLNQRDIPVTQAMIMVEAKRVFDELKEVDDPPGVEFKASRGWFDRFKRRANLKLVRLSSDSNLEPGELPRTFRSVSEDDASASFDARKDRNVLYKRKRLVRGSSLGKVNKESLLRRKNLRRKKHAREKTSSPRVTLRLHQIKERKEKAKSGAASDKTGHHDNYNTSSNMESNKGSEDATTNKEPGTGNEEIEAGGEQGVKDSSVTSPKEITEPDVAPVKRSHSTEDDGTQEESRKKRRKEGGKSGSNSGGSPKSVIESEGEDAKSVGSPGPKVPPLKIVIAGASLEEPGSGRPGKNGGARHHLPYVVSTSSGGEGEATSPPSDDHEEHGKRVLRSHRSGGGSGNSSPAAAAGDTPPRCGITSPPPQQPEPEEKPAEEPPPVELHPRKRKLRPKESATSNTSQTNTNQSQSTTEPPELQHFSDLAVSNSYQLFLNIRKQIERKRKGLFPVQPKPPQGFKDYLMNRCTYVLAGNAANRVPPPSTNPPATVSPQLKDLYISQEKERHRLLMQHVIEKEKLVLSVEQEILRVHGRAARALANQALPFSACTILRDEEVYSAITPEQEEKDRNARSRYNGRLFLSWLQDVDDKWEKIKEAMLLRHHNEAESLHAVQKMDWEWKLKEVGLCDFKVKPVIDDNHVPMVHVSDDFDLLPA